MNTTKLLLVEDDDSLAFIVKGSLELTGRYEVCLAGNGKEGIALYHLFKPDVIVSDIEMPEMSGEEFVSHIRHHDPHTPILFATGRTTPQDLIKGYQLDIDNYIRKPYLSEELDAHIQGVLKRRSQPSGDTTMENPDVHPLGLFRFHVKQRNLQLHDTHLKLTPRQADILWMLYQRKGELVLRKEILTIHWDSVDYYSSRSLDVFIQQLRALLKADPSLRIETERGEGFRLIHQ